MESSRFGSSGNLSQTSSQLSETGQESTGGSELEESFHSYHSTGFHPSTNGQPRTNGHHPANGHAPLGEQEIHRLSPEVGRGLKNNTPAETGSSKLQRYCFCSVHCFAISIMSISIMRIIRRYYRNLEIFITSFCHCTLYFMLPRFHDDGPPLPFTPSRVRWLKAINKVRVQLREVGTVSLISSTISELFFFSYFFSVLHHTTTMHIYSPAQSLSLFYQWLSGASLVV